MIKINGYEIPYSIRTGGEVYVSVPYEYLEIEEEGKDKLNDVIIEAYLWNSNDVIALLLINDCLLRQYRYKINRNLIIYYLPYARQDRVCNYEESYSLQVIGYLINICKFNKIYLVDPHSAQAEICLSTNRVISTLHLLYNKIHKNITVVIPDQGAMYRGNKFPHNKVWFDKKRDKQGNVTIVYKIGKLKAENIVIDDICDGGRTFIELAKVINKKISQKLILYTTYGIYCNGVDELFKYYDEVWCMFPHPDLPENVLRRITLITPPTLQEIMQCV